MFEPTSRDRLAGTGVIEYAKQTHTTPMGVTDFNTVHAFRVNCELAKKATAGGFRWAGTSAPNAGDFQLVDARPDATGYEVRIQIAPGGSAENQQLDVHANCVKSRAQRGTPPS
jgi:hypothetical protein